VLPSTGEVTDLRTRAAMLDDGIDLLRAVWSGAAEHRGPHYQFTCPLPEQREVGRPVQPTIPIWVVGVWPRPKSMRRVLRCEGIVPQYNLEGRDTTPQDVRDLRAWLAENGARPDVEVISEGETSSDSTAGRDVVQQWADAGCTWWLETRWEMPHHSPQRLQEIRSRIVAGPPSSSRNPGQ
jgi:hypothetical protein